MRATTAVLVGLAVVAGVVVVLHHLLLRRSLPRTSGEVELGGISAPVRIVRDRNGVPHISAASMEDAAFACGVLHAQDRGWQLELSRLVAAGRVAEIAGAEGIAADRLLRRLGLTRVALAEEAALEGDARRMLEAYAAGINAILCTGAQPRPLELLLLRRRFAPWRPADSIAYSKLVSLGLALDQDMELLRLRILEVCSPELAAHLELAYPPENPDIVAGHAPTDAALAAAAERLRATFAQASRWLPAGTAAAASNSWVVDGSRTRSGRPLLCNDPHLPPSLPSIWYQLHVDVADDFRAAGVGFVGLPFCVIGHNQRIAWGFTNSFADVQDLVVEEFTDASCRSHRTERGELDCEIRTETIAVRGGGDVVEEVVLTRHGPVVERFAAADGAPARGLALQWSALRPSADDIGGLLELQRARDFAGFRGALRFLSGAPQNAVYADTEGHIGYAIGGRVPRRPQPASPLPLSGWDADRRFCGELSADEVPHLLDPDERAVVTANNRVVGEGYPHHIAFDYMNGYRARRIGLLLGGRTDLSCERMAAVQMDVVCPPAVETVALLRTIRCQDPVVEVARQQLVAWDGVMEIDAAEPTVYSCFVRHLGREVLEPHCGERWTLLLGQLEHPVFGIAGNTTGRLTPRLLRMWREDDRSLLGGRDWPTVASAALAAALEELRRSVGAGRRLRWGRNHAMPLAHALGGRRPLGLLFNRRSLEVGGDTDTVHQTAFVPGAGYAAKGWAPSWRMIVDVGDFDASTGVLLGGQSGHPGSRHYDDSVEDWRNNRQRPLGWGEQTADKGVEAVLTLSPRSAASPARSDR